MALVYRTARGDATNTLGYVELLALQLNEHAPEDTARSMQGWVWEFGLRVMREDADVTLSVHGVSQVHCFLSVDSVVEL